MELLENILYNIDLVLDSERKRHIVGGFLMSISMLFGGLAVTVMTIKKEDDENEE